MTTATAEQPQTTSIIPAPEPPKGKAAGLTVVDNSVFANLLDTAKFEHIWRVSNMYARTQFVPEVYRNKPEDCFVACQMAVRLGLDPLMFMQNTYIVHGKPGMEAKLAIALINSSGLFQDSLDYEVEGGSDPHATTYRVRAFAVRKSTGKVVEGPWVDWSLVKKEGWDGKNGSKWKTMPGLMFMYRAATFFGRLHCPERMMGMQTIDEVEDVHGVKYVENTARPSGAEALASRIISQQAVAGESGAEAEPEKPQQSTTTPEELQTKLDQKREEAAKAGEFKVEDADLKPVAQKVFEEITARAHSELGVEGAECRRVALNYLWSIRVAFSGLNTSAADKKKAREELEMADWTALAKS